MKVVYLLYSLNAVVYV